MLTTGCECPIDVKPENLRAMVRTGKSYMGKKTHAKAQAAQAVDAQTYAKIELEGELANAMANLKFADVMKLVNQAVDEGVDALTILSDCRAGMDQVGEMYNTGEYFLSELIMSADIFKKVAEKIEPLLMDGQQASSLGAVVIATPKGGGHS